ncbi:UNVERIFIED_CONTAM: hypothetical protein K2H54_008614 [Gekko kuhli]
MEVTPGVFEKTPGSWANKHLQSPTWVGVSPSASSRWEGAQSGPLVIIPLLSHLGRLQVLLGLLMDPLSTVLQAKHFIDSPRLLVAYGLVHCIPAVFALEIRVEHHRHRDVRGCGGMQQGPEARTSRPSKAGFPRILVGHRTPFPGARAEAADCPVGWYYGGRGAVPSG